jgi:hypothetical protein
LWSVIHIEALVTLEFRLGQLESVIDPPRAYRECRCGATLTNIVREREMLGPFEWMNGEGPYPLICADKRIWFTAGPWDKTWRTDAVLHSVWFALSYIASVLSCPTSCLACHVLHPSWFVVPYIPSYTLSGLSCPLLSCPVLSCPVLSCPVLSCIPLGSSWPTSCLVRRLQHPMWFVQSYIESYLPCPTSRLIFPIIHPVLFSLSYVSSDSSCPTSRLFCLVIHPV